MEPFGMDELRRRADAAAKLVADGKTIDAIRAYGEIVRRNPDIPQLYPVLCGLYLEAERTDMPETWMARAVENDRSFERTLLDLAKKIAGTDRFSALRILCALTRSSSGSREIWNDLGVVQFSLNMIDQAEQSFEKAVAIDGGFTEAVVNLASLRAATGRAGEATVEATGSERRKKLLFIGVDGATLKVIEPMVERGLLPNFARIMRTGVSRVLKSTVPYLTPTAWQSMALGVNPGKHGTWEFKERNPDDYGFHLVRRNMTGTFWDMLGDAGKRVGVIDWPYSYPAKKVNGIMLTGRPLDRMTEFCEPRDIESRLGFDYRSWPSAPGGGDEAYWGNVDALKDLIAGWVDVTENRQRVLKHYLADGTYDMLACVFSITDRLQHWFWIGHDETHPAHRKMNSIYGNPPELAYEMVDRCLGEVFEMIDADTNVVLVSDHGFTRVKKFFNVNNWLRGEGLMTWREDVPVDTEKKDDWFNIHVDWSKTKAFCFGNGHIYVNLKGREPQGIVEPGEEHERLKDELIEKLYGIRDPENGQRVFQLVAKKEDMYSGDRMEGMPDIVTITLNDEYIAKDELLPTNPDFLFGPPPLTGTGYHSMDGVFMGMGPDFKQGERLGPAQIVDVTPTVLRLFGFEIPGHIDGSVLEDGLLEDAGVAAPVEPTSEPAPEAGPSGVEDEAGEEEMKTQLRSLGYL
jgi:predicted AlkP superfamily phosphohydrolase/phosphomutase